MNYNISIYVNNSNIHYIHVCVKFHLNLTYNICEFGCEEHKFPFRLKKLNLIIFLKMHIPIPFWRLCPSRVWEGWCWPLARVIAPSCLPFGCHSLAGLVASGSNCQRGTRPMQPLLMVQWNKRGNKKCHLNHYWSMIPYVLKANLPYLHGECMEMFL